MRPELVAVAPTQVADVTVGGLVKVGVGRTVTVVATVAEQPAELIHVAE